MANAAATADLVCGIEAAKISEEAVDAALSALDIVPAPGMKLPGRVELLVEHFKALPDSKLADCDACGAMSDADAFPACPFCGVGGENPAPGGEPAHEPDGDDAPSADYSGEDGPGEPDDAETNVTLDPDNLPPMAPEAPRPIVDVKAAKKAEREKRRAEAAAVKAAKKAPKAPAQDATGAAVTAIVKPAPAAQVVGPAGTVEQLDKAVAEVLSLVRMAETGAWHVARKIAEIAESQIWKLRVGEDGKVAYRNFEAFANAELDMSREYARDLLKMAVRYTQQDFEQVGPGKLRFVLRAPEDQQAEVLQGIKEQGTTKREVEADVARRRAAAGMKDEKQSAKAKKKAAKRAAAGKKPESGGKITVASILGRQSVKLYKKPEKRVADASELVRAKRLGDRPYGYLDLGNDTRCWFEVTTDGAGELVMKVDIRRNEE